MGKKRAAVIGSSEEESLKAKKAVKLEQKKLREGKAPAPVILSEVEESLKPTTPEPTPETKTKRDARIRGKAYKAAKSKIDSDKTYSLVDGLTLLKDVTLTKFDPTVELHVVLKNTPNGKLVVSLPHYTAAPKKIVVATDEVIKNIADGKIDFDVLVASPATMGKLVKFAKVLGPRGLMPNPKTGTVSDKPEETAKHLAKDTSTTLKLDKTSPVIHTVVGKLSLGDAKLSANIVSLLSVVSPTNLKKVVLKSTMSPAIKIQV